LESGERRIEGKAGPWNVPTRLHLEIAKTREILLKERIDSCTLPLRKSQELQSRRLADVQKY
jgi:hypothetical protein